MRVAVEVCVASVEEAVVAGRCGVDSIELCSWLACGGLTPSIGLVQEVAEHMAIPVRVLVRSTPHGFRYSMEETQVMLRDLALISRVPGVHGLVLGALDEDHLPNRSYMRQALQRIAGSECTFHRAIDRSADLESAFDRCVSLGIHRILSSGSATLAADGAARLGWMVQHAPPDLRIAAAGGINAGNVVQLVDRTGVQEIHFAAQRAVEAPLERVALSSFHAPATFVTQPDAAKIEGVLEALSKAGLR